MAALQENSMNHFKKPSFTCNTHLCFVDIGVGVCVCVCVCVFGVGGMINWKKRRKSACSNFGHLSIYLLNSY